MLQEDEAREQTRDAAVLEMLAHLWRSRTNQREAVHQSKRLREPSKAGLGPEEEGKCVAAKSRGLSEAGGDCHRTGGLVVAGNTSYRTRGGYIFLRRPR